MRRQSHGGDIGGGPKCTFTEHLSRQKRKAVKLQPNHIFLASYVGFDMG